jgi:Uma2 family endonuclease
MATVTKPTETSRYLLRGVSYATYRALSVDLENAGSRTRLTFDRGALEFMSPLYEHERGSFLLGQLIVAVAFVLDIEIASGKSTTLSREDLDRGVEPDESIYIANESRVRFHREIDLPDDPPPDLAIEVDISNSSLDKLSIYAALGVPEFWKLDRGRLQILALGDDGRYHDVESSVSFPFLMRAEVEEWVRRRETMGQTTWLRAVHTWVRETVAPRLDRPGGVT